MRIRFPYSTKLLRALKGLQLPRVLGLLWQTGRGGLLLLLALLLLENLAFLASMYSGKLLVAAVGAKAAAPAHLYRLLALTAGATLLYVTVRTVGAYCSEKQAAQVGAFVDDKLHACALRLDYAFFETPAYYDTLKRAMDAGTDKPQSILLNLVELAKHLLLLAGLLGLLFAIHWLLLPLIVLFVLPMAALRLQQAGRLHTLRLSHTRQERRTQYLGELLTGNATAKEIRSFGTGTYLAALRRQLYNGLLAQRLQLRRLSALQEGVVTASVLLGLFACVAFICMEAARGRKGVGDLALFLVVFPQLNMVLFGLSGSLGALYANSWYTTQLFTLFDLQPANPPKGALPLPPPTRGWKLDGVCFRYPHGNGEVLHQINMELPPGKVVALVGFNGAGKTTLIKLLSRLYAPTCGNITIEGLPVSNIDSTTYASAVSVVFQDFGKYAMSASDNIRLGAVNRKEEPVVIREAAHQAGAAAFISQLPLGYQTPLCRLLDEGAELSAGQWQKIALARALYRKARLLILDEATSALDAVSERRFFDGLHENIGNSTALIISHRLSAVQHADYIYVMDHGRIVQQGTHEALLKSGGIYATLYHKKSMAVA